MIHVGPVARQEFLCASRASHRAIAREFSSEFGRAVRSNSWSSADVFCLHQICAAQTGNRWCVRKSVGAHCDRDECMEHVRPSTATRSSCLNCPLEYHISHVHLGTSATRRRHRIICALGRAHAHTAAVHVCRCALARSRAPVHEWVEPIVCVREHVC